jgi:hypothetical protein
METRARAQGAVRAIVVLDAQQGRIAATQRALLAELEGTGHHATFALRRLPIVGVSATPATLAALERSPRVVSVQEDGLNRLLLADSLPLVGADLTTLAGLDGAGQAVAVIDSGVDSSHPFFGDRVIEEACFSGSGHCPDGSTEQIGLGSAVPCTFANGCSHGTHIAGIVAGADVALSGVAPASEIIAIQVLSRFTGAACAGTEDPCAIAFDADILRAGDHVLDLAATYDIAAMNLSLGGATFQSQQVCDAQNPGYKLMIDQLRAAGIATIAATGNDGLSDRVQKPACISTAVSVGATSKSGGIAFYSNTAPFLALVAPGTAILSSTTGGGFASRYGTSMAAPHVAGAWAVLKQNDPAASVSTILSTLRQSGVLVTDRAGVQVPRVNVFSAIGGLSVELPVGGSRLLIRNRIPEEPARNRISFKSQGGPIPVAPPESDGDPRCAFGNGASLTISSPTSGEVLSQDLPCENWSIMGTSERSKGYRYRDRAGLLGPCRKVRIHKRGQVSALCKGSELAGVDYDLRVGEGQSPVEIRLTTGSSITYCAEFGGELLQDGTDGRSFRARDAPAPSSCPPLVP